MTKTSGFGGIGRAFRSRNFRIYCTGGIVSLVGLWVHKVAVGWLTWELTHSAAWLGVIAFAELFPTVFVSPLAGAFADRGDYRLQMITAQVLAGVLAAVLAGLTFTGTITIELLLAISIVQGLITAFNHPARLAMVPSLVEAKDLSAAIAVNSATFNGARFLGPMVAGVIILWGGTAPAFAFNSISYLWFVAMLARLRLAPRARAVRPASGILGDTLEGFRYVAGHFGISSLLILLTATATLLRPYMELLPGFAAEVFGRGADGLAMLTSATGFGAVVAGVWLARRGRVQGLTRILVSYMVVCAAALFVLASGGAFWVGLGAIAVIGFSLVAVGVSTQTLLQNAVEGAMRGRVMSLYGVIFLGGPAVGALVMGWIASDAGLGPPVAGGAAMCLVVWLWAMRRVWRAAPGLEEERTPRRP
jgi:MFS family permease